MDLRNLRFSTVEQQEPDDRTCYGQLWQNSWRTQYCNWDDLRRKDWLQFPKCSSNCWQLIRKSTWPCLRQVPQSNQFSWVHPGIHWWIKQEQCVPPEYRARGPSSYQTRDEMLAESYTSHAQLTSVECDLARKEPIDAIVRSHWQVIHGLRILERKRVADDLHDCQANEVPSLDAHFRTWIQDERCDQERWKNPTQSKRGGSQSQAHFGSLQYATHAGFPYWRLSVNLPDERSFDRRVLRWHQAYPHETTFWHHLALRRPIQKWAFQQLRFKQGEPPKQSWFLRQKRLPQSTRQLSFNCKQIENLHSVGVFRKLDPSSDRYLSHHFKCTSRNVWQKPSSEEQKVDQRTPRLHQEFALTEGDSSLALLFERNHHHRIGEIRVDGFHLDEGLCH